MKLETLEQYLDGALDAAETRSMNSAIAADEVLAARVQRLRSQRTLRAAALSTYSPTADESRSLAMATIDACYDQQMAPVGRIGSGWMKKFGAVAAALVIAAVSFYAGRSTGSPVNVAGTPANQGPFVVVVKDRVGNVLEEKQFEDRQKAEAYVEGLAAEQPDESATVDDGVPTGGVM